MDLRDAEAMAIREMNRHALSHWTFAWDDRRRRFGSCTWAKRTITLSRPLTEMNPVHQVRETILHEIAHALAGQDAGHGPAWRRVARQIGSTGERCYGAEVRQPATTARISFTK